MPSLSPRGLAPSLLSGALALVPPPHNNARISKVKDRLQHLLLENIQKERGGQLIERMLMKSTLNMLAELGVDGPSVTPRPLHRQVKGPHAFLG